MAYPLASYAAPPVPLSRGGVQRRMSDAEYDRVVYGQVGQSTEDEKRHCQELGEEARQWYDRRAGFLAARKDANDLYFSRPWERTIRLEDGRFMKEKDYLAERGRVAVVMGIVSPVIDHMQGSYRQNKSKRQVYGTKRDDAEQTEALNLLWHRERDEAGSAQVEAEEYLEWLLSGAAAFRTTYSLDPEKERHVVRDESVHQTRLFYNLDVKGRRLDGLRLVGQNWDLTLDGIIQFFASSPQEAEAIARKYATNTRGTWGAAAYNPVGFYASGAFNTAGETGLERVHEIWCTKNEWQVYARDRLPEIQAEISLQAAQALGATDLNTALGEMEAQGVDGALMLAKILPPQALALLARPATIPQGYGRLHLSGEALAAEQLGRLAVGIPPLEVEAPRWLPGWWQYWLTPNYEKLAAQPTPYWHGGHCFTLGTAVWRDGETRGLAHSLADTQRWLGRLLTSIDHQMTTSPHGTVLYDLDILEKSGLTQAEADAAFSRADASIGLKTGNKPLASVFEQITSQSVAAGYFEMVPLLLQMAERLTGVTDSALGLEQKAGTPYAARAHDAIQSALSVLIFPDTYMELMREKDRKAVRLVQQVKDRPELLRDARRSAMGQGPLMYDPLRARALAVDISLGSAADTPTQQLANEEALRQDATNGWISPKTYYSISGRPDAPKILEAIRREEQEMVAQAQALAEAGVNLSEQQPQKGKPR